MTIVSVIPKTWKNKLIDIDDEVSKCIKNVWSEVSKLLSSTDKEDSITQRLVDVLRVTGEIKEFGFIDIQFKLREKDLVGDFSTKGIIDMVLILDQDHQKYIAYECKRINRIDKNNKRAASLAGSYVDEGLMRYVNEQYSENLPYGCMIGYVMDGDMSFALQQIFSAINNRKGNLNLITTPTSSACLKFPRFDTKHKRIRSNSLVDVRHRLYPVT
jgi:hypothetical protein